MSDQPYINLLDPQFYVDPWDAYRWLRDNSPVHWDPVQQLWGISRYADVMAIENDGGFYSSFKGSRPKLDQSADRSMINLDDPAHQDQRKLVVRRFTPKAVRDHEAEVHRLCDEIIDAAIASGSGHIEVVEQVASRLPAMEIAHLLGYGYDGWELIREVSETTMYAGGQTNADGSPQTSFDDLADVMLRWAGATLEIVEARRQEPQDDLISIWAHTEQGGERWSDDKILEECLLVVDGGAETTRAVIGAICRELALQPDVQRQLRDDPSLLATTAVEEFIRWVSPVLNMRRTVTRDHELHGQQLKAGEELLLMYPSANRDPRAFDEPDVFDVTREIKHHLGFGFGTHVCLGAPLARMELRIMFEHLLARLPEWHLAPGTEPKILAATFARAWDAVHVEFDPAAVKPALAAVG